MAFLGNEIIQSRLWVGAETPPPPSQNYKNAFPITVFDAVREQMSDEDSPTLTTVLAEIRKAIQELQPILPAHPANYLVTYGGVAGAVGSIQISNTIPLAESEQSNDRIPSEKAVGELLRRLNLVNSGGTGSDDTSTRITWDTIVGKPNIVSGLGDSETDILSQKAITTIIQDLLEEIHSSGPEEDQLALQALQQHLDASNPHRITTDLIGAATKTALNEHIANRENPHRVTKEQIGLDQVDNTSDLDKPISNAVQSALEELIRRIQSLEENSGSGGTISVLKFTLGYQAETGRLRATFTDGTYVDALIPTARFLQNLEYQPETNQIIATRLDGSTCTVDLDFLLIENQLSDSATIRFTKDDDGKIVGSIAPASIGSEHLKKRSVTGEHIAHEVIDSEHLKNDAVTGPHIKDRVITSQKIAEKAVTSEHLSNNAVTSSKLAADLVLRGIPTTEDDIPEEVTSNELVTAKWVRKLLEGFTPPEPEEPELDPDPEEPETPQTPVLEKRSVTGEYLFSSAIKNRILAVLEANGDPTWTQVNQAMLEDGIVSTEKLADQSVTSPKLANSSVKSRHIENQAINKEHLAESSVELEKIVPSPIGNRVLAVLTEGSHPIYSQIQSAMLANGSVTEEKLADGAIGLKKIQSSNTGNVVLGVTMSGHAPTWTKITKAMLEDHAVSGEKLFTSPQGNMVLGVIEPSGTPRYTKIISELIQDYAVTGPKLADGSVGSRALANFAVQSKHLEKKSILLEHLSEEVLNRMGGGSGGTATGILPSNEPNRVYVTGENPKDGPQWAQIVGDMIAEQSIPLSKLAPSSKDYVVLGARAPGATPDYQRLTGEFLEDHTVGSDALKEDLYLRGSPTIENHPPEDSDDHTIADTNWVRNLVEKTLLDSYPGGGTNLPEHSVTGEHLFTSSLAPSVLGLDRSNGVAKYMKVVGEMMEDATITSEKLAANLHLRGSPTLETRPSEDASDAIGTGNQIVDAQWVRDHVNAIKTEIYDHLKETLCCLKEPDLSTIPDYGVRYSGIDPDRVDAILNETAEDIESVEDYQAGNLNIGAIEEDRLEGIIDQSVIPFRTGDIRLDDERMTPIPINRIAAIMNSVFDDKELEFDPISSEPGFEILPEDIHVFGCCCNPAFCGASLLRRYITPIPSGNVEAILNGEGIPTPTDSVTIEDSTIQPIATDVIEQMVERDEITTPDDTAPLSINGHTLERIPLERLKEVIYGAVTSSEEPMDITEYDTEEGEDSEGGDGSNATLSPNSIITDYLKDRAVTGPKLFTSSIGNMVLAVLEPNRDPVYTKVTKEMLAEMIFDSSMLSPSNDPYVVLGTLKDCRPIYTKIVEQMLGDLSVSTRVLGSYSVTKEKLADGSVTAPKLAKEPMIENIHMEDQSVSTRVLKDQAVTNDKVADHTLAGSKLQKETELPAYVSIAEHADYERRSLHNMILSPNMPYHGKNGDVWLRFY